MATDGNVDSLQLALVLFVLLLRLFGGEIEMLGIRIVDSLITGLTLKRVVLRRERAVAEAYLILFGLHICASTYGYLSSRLPYPVRGQGSRVRVGAPIVEGRTLPRGWE